MKYPDMREYIRFLFFFLDEFSTTAEKVSKRGRPQTYLDASLIVFYTVMPLKGITSMRTASVLISSPDLPSTMSVAGVSVSCDAGS